MRIYLSTYLEKEYPAVYLDLTNALDETGVEHLLLPYSNEVWARDYICLSI